MIELVLTSVTYKLYVHVLQLICTVCKGYIYLAVTVRFCECDVTQDVGVTASSQSTMHTHGLSFPNLDVLHIIINLACAWCRD